MRPLRTSQWNYICFANGDFYLFRFTVTEKAVIADVFAYSIGLPRCAGFVLISERVILRKFQRPIVDKFAVGWHFVFWRFLVVPLVFSLSAFQVVSRTYFENISSIFVDIVADI